MNVEKVDITDAKACKKFVTNVAKKYGKIGLMPIFYILST